MGKKDKRINR